MIKLDRPSRVRIGGFVYKIEWMDGNWTSSVNRYGECSSVNQVIRINDTISTERTASTFIHELTHAIIDWFGINSEKMTDEDAAHALGKCFPIIWRDNPAAFEWWGSLVRGESDAVEK